MKRILSIFSAVLFLGQVIANTSDKHLGSQPTAADGGYIVLWDCTTNSFATANTMEWDQTFVFAIDVTGTQLATWVNGTPSTGLVRGVGADLWRVDGSNREGKQYPGQISRLWRIQGNIWGATYNFHQMGLDGYRPENGETTQIAIRLFGFESPMGPNCNSTYPIQGNWWVGQGGTYNWMEGFTAPNSVQYFFQFAPYTGTKTDPILVNSIAFDASANAYVDAGKNVYLDRGAEAVHNYKVIYNGYASPWSTRSGDCYVASTGVECQQCPDMVTIPYPNLTYNLNADAFPIELPAASGTNVRYQWYYYTDANPTPQPYTGEGAQTNNCTPATNTEGKTYYYCMVYSNECPDGVQYCNTADVTVQGCQTLSGTSFTLTSTKTTYDEGEKVVLTANFSGYGGEHTYVWTLNGTPIDSSATHQIIQEFQYSTLTIPAAAVADGGVYSVTIYDGPDCTKNASRSITINAADPKPDPEPEPEERVTELTVCKDEPIVLRADLNGHLYLWNTGETTQQITVTPSKVGTETYSVRVYDYKVETTDNLMANGDFENYTDYHQKPAGFTSDYEYLAFSPTATRLYDTYSGKNGVYLLSCDAKNTWDDYAQVKPHGGQYFAMFDAAQKGFAWRATTTDNPNMKLQKGGVYIFSYWAADLNEANQRQHPAELQFSINYKDDATGQMTKEYLGQVMVLGKDNKWHYSETYWTAPCNSSYIEIGVEDLNDYAGVGNDFGLDDIIFQMIKNEKGTSVDRQKWVLTVEDCTPEECVDDRIYRKWNDLLFVDNADQRYTAYQWYADGVALTGATGQFYYEENKVLQGDGHAYHCVATTTTGSKETMCAQLFENFPTSISAGRKPAPSQVRVYTPTGKLVFTGATVEEITGKLYPGFYMVHYTDAEGNEKTEKLLIH